LTVANLGRFVYKTSLNIIEPHKVQLLNLVSHVSSELNERF